MSAKGNMIEKPQSIHMANQEKEAIEEKIRQYRFIFEQAIDAIALVNKDGAFIDMNEAACRLFRASKEKLLQKHFQDYLHP